MQIGFPLKYALAGLLLMAGASASLAEETARSAIDALMVAGTELSGPLMGMTADHAKFPSLQGPFATPQDVTKACLACHTEAGEHVMKTIHWTWTFKDPRTGQTLGKEHVINNFCTNAKGNEGMCAQCHIGNGWTDTGFDFADQNNIDCLACHDTTGTYFRLTPTKGNAACTTLSSSSKSYDLANVASHVGLPSRENCGACHYNGGGGDGVKHGDLDSSLNDPPRALDVHMSKEGGNFSCTACHVTDKHEIAGSHYDMIARDETGPGMPGSTRKTATCKSCHTATPHEKTDLIGIELNAHAERVACQTCHIPTFARGGVATMTNWDWSTAGKTKNGQGYLEENYKQGNGEERHTYWSIKGDFVWGENLVPTYKWFDGGMKYTLPDDKLDVDHPPVVINAVLGAPADPKSRIWPFKVMRTNIPYDAGNKTLVFNHLWGNDDTSFWGNFDMLKAVAAGMEQQKRPFSGEVGFIQSVSNWPITHMVAPKKDALRCAACHSRDGRLAGVPGVYMPGRDRIGWLDLIGFGLFGLTLFGIIVHGAIRFVMRGRHANKGDLA